MAQIITMEVAEEDAQVLQALVFKARSVGKSLDELLAGLKDSGHLLTLAINGGAIVIQDLASYEKLLDEKDTAEAVAGIKRGLESMKAGRRRPAVEVFDEIRQQLGLPEKNLKGKKHHDQRIHH
jgi:hypothetical protein